MKGKINGSAYYFGRNGSAALKFNNGIREGLTLEFCPNGKVSFRGYLKNGKFLGLSSWWHCNGAKEQEGIRINDTKVGVWREWDEKGNLVRTEDHGNQKLIDSMSGNFPPYIILK